MKTVAYSGALVPEEWIAAHGLRPHRLQPRPPSGRSPFTVTRGVCPYAGAIIDTACAGMDASALVLTTACDQMRYAAALLETRGSCPVFLMNVPSTWQTAAVRQLYLEELQRLGRFLVGLGGTSPNTAELARVMLAYDRARRAPRVPENVCTSNRPPSPGIPLAILGGPLLDSDGALFDLVERAGGRMVLDATEGGQRTMPRAFDAVRVAADPLPELADAYFGAIPDAFRRPNTRLYEWLDRELSAGQVRGIIFRRYVWCDLWHAEWQRLREWSSLPILEIDVDSNHSGIPNRIQGRIEAFLETLR